MRGEGRGELLGLSQFVQLYTGAQINFGDLTPYLTYDDMPISTFWWKRREERVCSCWLHASGPGKTSGFCLFTCLHPRYCPEQNRIQELCHLTSQFLFFKHIFKGSLTRDFRLQVYSINRCPPAPWVSHWDRFELIRKFAEIIGNECLSARCQWLRR